MGRQLVRVPPDFEHPVDQRGDPVPGAHLEALYKLDAAACSSFQVYENVTEGTPVSPVFDSAEDLVRWLVQQGYSDQTAKALISEGSVPSFVVTHDRKVVPGTAASKTSDA